MGNRKSASNTMGIAAISRKRLEQSTNPLESNEEQNKWILTERDTAFLVSQTGKYKYLFSLKKSNKKSHTIFNDICRFFSNKKSKYYKARCFSVSQN
jgi:hypothetical protein